MPQNARILGLAALVAAFLAGGCVSETTDGAKTPELAACETAKPAAGWTYPAGPYGTDVGKRFEDFKLSDCDGKDVAFADVLGDARLVLFNVGSGWCQPCLDETKHLENDVYRKHCKAGLRIVQVLYQDENSLPAPKAFCRAWRDKHKLTFPVLVDPLFNTQKYFDNAQKQTPLNMLVDASGTIRYRRTGQVPADLDAEITKLLAE